MKPLRSFLLTDTVTLSAVRGHGDEVLMGLEEGQDCLAVAAGNGFEGAVLSLQELLEHRLATLQGALDALRTYTAHNAPGRPDSAPATPAPMEWIGERAPAEAVYPSASKGDMVVRDMHYPHLINALAKLDRNGEQDGSLADNLRAEVAWRNATYTPEQS